MSIAVDDTEYDRAISIRINRPEARNALNASMLNDLAKVITDSSGFRKKRCIVIRGAGTCFTSGADLKEYRRNAASRQKLNDSIRRLLFAVEDSDVPVVTVIHGYSIGLGLALCAASHISICTKSAYFQLPEVALGLFPSPAFAYLVNITGPKKALAWCLRNNRISSSEAVRSGLIASVHEESEIDQVVASLQFSLSQLPDSVIAQGIRMYKLGCRGSDDRSLKLASFAMIEGEMRSPDKPAHE